MFRMEIDSSPSLSPSSASSADASSPSNQDRIIQRLGLVGVPDENLEHLQPGLVAFAKNNRSQIRELVAALLPTDEETLEAVLEEAESTNAGSNLEESFQESMVWVQWLMFEGEPKTALEHLGKINVGPRGVCGAVWGNNDIAYRCRTCEHDPTCAICVPCFQNGNHRDHDYSIIYTGGGCCDCGDITAWKREGFCSKHKGAEQIQPLPDEFANSLGPVLDALFECWKNKLLFAESRSQCSPRANDHVAELKKVADKLTSAVVKMLLEFCKYSESLLSFVSGRVSSTLGLLDVLVRAEKFMSRAVVKKLHELLLKLQSEPLFKYEFAKVFLSYYPSVVNEAVKECNDIVFKKYPLLSTFSVQIFTVPTLTPRLVKEMNLLAMLMECLGDIFASCTGEDGRLQIAKWGNLYEATLRVVEDIRFVMSHSVVPKYVTRDRRDLSRTWMRLLSFVQGTNPQKRETGMHIEEENEHMHLPFVLGHSVANIHSFLVTGAFSTSVDGETDEDVLFKTYKHEVEDQDSLRHAKVGRLSQESSVSSNTGRSLPDHSSQAADSFPIPASVLWLTFECLKAIENWLGVDNTCGPHLGVLSSKTNSISGNNFCAWKRTLSKFRRGRYMFRSYSSPSSNSRTISSNDFFGKQSISPSHSPYNAGSDSESIGQDGSDDNSTVGECVTEIEAFRVLSLSNWPDFVYDVSSQDISVHIPLHRLLSMVLQRSLGKCYGDSSVHLVFTNGASPPSSFDVDFFGHILGGCHPYGFSAFVMEHPLRIRVFCAEVHAGMWRKNGDAAILSCEWYRSVRWSEQGLELDLFLLQCCAALAPADLYVKRILERFRLSNYLSFGLERTSEYEPALVQEMLTLLIQVVQERRFCGLTAAECLQRELVYKLSIGDATHSQLLKSLPRDLSKVDQLQEILDTVAVYSNPSGMNQGMYKLRLGYWKELDLYHPRWNSRDLQLAEERYVRFCNASALISQLPKWTKIYEPLSGVAKIATCKTVLQIIRAVLFYAVYSDTSTDSRAPDGVLLTALHLTSLALDICSVQKASGDRSCYVGNKIPILEFANEEITMNGYGEQSLLSLLVLLMRLHGKGNAGGYVEAGNFNLSPLAENLLKKFAELEPACIITLQNLAPEVVSQLSQFNSNIDSSAGLLSDADRRKAKARERQAAILEKMKAQQSKFWDSVNSTSDDDMDGSNVGQEVCDSPVKHDSGESADNVCSLCHDSSSRSPLSFLILLQKSRLLSFVDREPPSWEQVSCSGKEHAAGKKAVNLSPQNSNDTSSSESRSPSQLMQTIQNAVDEFATNGQPGDVNAFLDFIRMQFPSLKNIELPQPSNDTKRKIVSSLETFEDNLYTSIRGGAHGNFLFSDLLDNDSGVAGSARTNESLLLGKYIVALSKETSDNPSASENDRSHYEKTQSETNMLQAYDGFGPSNCDGIYLSSCGHAVHQGCLDRYLSSLRERHIRRIVFEGGHIVDPDQGEFLCPVCRGLANSVLPALPGAPYKASRPSSIVLVDPSSAAGLSTLKNMEAGPLRLQDALSLLHRAADVAGRTEILQSLPVYCTGKTRLNLDSIFRVLCGMYFPSKDKISGPGRVSHSVILWDTLKYSLISTEVAARSRKNSLAPNYSLSAVYKELKSSNGFILSLLLNIVQSTRTVNLLSVLLRLRGVKLFAETICWRASSDDSQGRYSGQGGDMLCILEHADPETEVQYPDVQLWKRASDPILAHDAFSSLMWLLFCLPRPFLTCEESFLSLVHMFYVVTITQATIAYCRKQGHGFNELEYHDCVITDIYRAMEDYRVPQHYFDSNHINFSLDIKNAVRSMTFPYLRRCALLWNIIYSGTSAPFNDGSFVTSLPPYAANQMQYDSCLMDELSEVEKLEKMFNIPSFDDIINDNVFRAVALRWLNKLSRDFEVRSIPRSLHCTPAVPFKLMSLPQLYQDLLQRYIKQHCPNCGVTLEEPALCLLCGKLCSPNWKTCCRESGCQSHSMSCAAGTGAFLLIRKTTILLQRSARQAPWPSPYLDAFGEEDIEMHRGKPLYLNEERYAALTHMVASHGLDRSSKVLRQATIGAFLML